MFAQVAAYQERVRQLEERLLTCQLHEAKRIHERELSKRREEELVDENYRLSERIHELECCNLRESGDSDNENGNDDNEDAASIIIAQHQSQSLAAAEEEDVIDGPVETLDHALVICFAVGEKILYYS